jgi:MscS family membrane protein
MRARRTRVGVVLLGLFLIAPLAPVRAYAVQAGASEQQSAATQVAPQPGAPRANASAEATQSGLPRWASELLPQALLREGPLTLWWWQWLALPIVALLSYTIGHALGVLTGVVLGAASRQTGTVWDDRLHQKVAPTFRYAWTALTARLFLPALALGPSPRAALNTLLSTALIVAFTWAAWRSVAVLRELVLSGAWAAENPSVGSLLSVGAALTRALIVVFGALIVAETFGYSVNTALAGLGIGGVALALGAQKMIENLFGSLVLGLDQPFHVNDLVTVENVTGVVESIGMRSTRIRTPERTLVTIPNGKLAAMSIESLAARDRRCLTTTLSLAPPTTGAQARRVVEGVTRVLRTHPHVWQDTILVSLSGFSPLSWDVSVIAWFETTDELEFRRCRGDVLLAFVDVVNETGTSLAWQPGPQWIAPGRSTARDRARRGDQAGGSRE